MFVAAACCGWYLLRLVPQPSPCCYFEGHSPARCAYCAYALRPTVTVERTPVFTRYSESCVSRCIAVGAAYKRGVHLRRRRPRCIKRGARTSMYTIAYTGKRGRSDEKSVPPSLVSRSLRCWLVGLILCADLRGIFMRVSVRVCCACPSLWLCSIFSFMLIYASRPEIEPVHTARA